MCLKSFYLLSIILIFISCQFNTDKNFPTESEHYRAIYDVKGDSVGVRFFKDEKHSINIGRTNFWTTIKNYEEINLKKDRIFQMNLPVSGNPFSQNCLLDIRDLKGNEIRIHSRLSPIFSSLAPAIRFATNSNAEMIFWGMSKQDSIFKERIKVIDRNGQKLAEHFKKTNQEIYYYPNLAFNSNRQYVFCYTQDRLSMKSEWVLGLFELDGTQILEKKIKAKYIRNITLSEDGKIAFLKDQKSVSSGSQSLVIIDKRGNSLHEEVTDFVASGLKFRTNNVINLYQNFYDLSYKKVDITF